MQNLFDCINLTIQALVPSTASCWYVTNSVVQQIVDGEAIQGRRCDWVFTVEGVVKYTLELKNPITFSDTAFMRLYESFCENEWELVRNPADLKWEIRARSDPRRGNYRHLVIQVSLYVITSERIPCSMNHRPKTP
jgi:hypothetical protein